ncbi:MAG: hypothetical protein Kow00128_19660 [Deltaproteobacteria bacterium]
MSGPDDTTLQVTCPCCNAALVIDPADGTVKEWKEAKDPRKSADLRDAMKLLAEEKAKVDARYREIVRADKEKGAAMEKKFKEFLEKSQDEPAGKPLRDIDLD